MDLRRYRDLPGHPIGILPLDMDDVEHPLCRIDIPDLCETDLLVPGAGVETQHHKRVCFETPEIVGIHGCRFLSDHIVDLNRHRRDPVPVATARVLPEVVVQTNIDSTKAQYVPFNDFKIKWRRMYRWIEFDISDFLMDVPENVFSGILEYTFRKIVGKDAKYPKEVSEYLSSDAFVDMAQPIYIERRRKVSEGPEGENRNLMDSYRRLIDMGLVNDDPKLVLRWDEALRKGIGNASVLMWFAQINRNLDIPEIFDNAFDYAVYSRIAHIQCGFENQGPIRAEIFEQLLDRYPRRNQAIGELQNMGFEV